MRSLFWFLFGVANVLLLAWGMEAMAHGYMNIDPMDYYASFDLEYWREWWCSIRTDCWT